ncbi:MAG: gldM [Chitinophagaceae bacterium]|nr:gldM [Chitinophagaceae bacterium]
MALPKEPRQKMINLMYLVLTALLALNVSAEILNAFKTVDGSLQNANNTIESKNVDIFKSFQQKLNDPKTAERAKEWYPRAEHAKQMSDELYTYIDGLKLELKKAAGFNPPKDTTYKEDDLEAATRVLVDGPRGKELKSRLEKFRNDILSIHPDIKAEFDRSLPIDLRMPKSNNEASRKDWSTAYFHMTPTIAAITILSKFQNDVKNSEAQVVDFCHRKVGEVILVYNEFQAFAGTNSQYLMPGQQLEITAGVGAFSKAAQPTVTVDGSVVSLNAEGVAAYKTIVGGPGTYTKIVNISFTKPDGTKASIPKTVQYTVGAPTGASVSADAVKVLYIDLDNPLTITGGGGKGAEAVQVGISGGGGSLQNKGNGQYIARVTTPGTTTINVSTEGKTTPFTFRVRSVPDPLAKVGASKGGRMRVNDFKAQAGVRADLENFVFEGVKFTVTGFTMVFTGAGFPELAYRDVNGFSFNSVRDLIERVKPGTSVTIDNIEASGPGGKRNLPPIIFNLY